MKTWFRTLASLVVACSLMLSAQQVLAETSSVGDPGESWSIPNDADRGLHVQQFIDSFPGESVSYLVDEALRQNKMVDPTCKSVSDERCTSPRLTFSSILPMCGTISSRYCVEEFGVANADGTKSLATFNRYFPNKALNEFAADPSLRLPFGGTGSLLNLPEAAHAGGNLYYLSVLTEGSVDKANGAYLGKFSIRLNPVALKVGDGAIQGIDSGWSKETGGSGHAVGEWRQAGFGFSGTSFCVAGSATENLCAQRYAFPAGKKFYLKVRLQSQPGGWMHGRIYQPEISITQSQNYSTLEVAAFPVAVPAVYKVYQYPAMPQALKDQYDVRTGDYKPEVAKLSEADIQNRVKGGCGRTACTEDPLTRNKIVGPGPSDPLGMEQLKLWLPFVEDQATALLGTWSMRTLDGNELGGASQCFTNGEKGITGIVTTNATQYSGGPPVFNKEDQMLEYKVAAPHYVPKKKEEFFGTYDLLMRSDVARCVYGFSSAPIKASLSIVNNGASQKIATESLGEKNGWVFLSAGGFTFSDPTIRVKLTQDPPPQPTPTPTPTPSPTASATPTPTPTPSPVVTQAATSTKVTQSSKKTTITCSKSGKIKKVTAVKPKCPTGFKKV